MTYKETIDELISKISPTFVDFEKGREHRSAPTQVSSEFLTNKEQGDWAEKTLLEGINLNSKKYIAVKYGRDDDIIAGEEGFKEFYEEYQKELDNVGKRPDILIFDKNDFPFEETNISNWDIETLDVIVPKAKCGIEVRSSAFLIDKYEEYMCSKNEQLIEEALEIKEQIIEGYSDLLKGKDEALFKIINSLSIDNIHVLSFRKPTWRTSEELVELSNLIKRLKDVIKEVSEKRTFLGITPKVEDLKVVYTWIQRYNVPHYYVQVFFDKAYGVPFSKILDFIGQPELEGKSYFIESDVKNQNKTTIKIQANKEVNVLNKVDLPDHFSVMKELGRGRLLFFVKFKNSIASINAIGFKELFGFDL